MYFWNGGHVKYGRAESMSYLLYNIENVSVEDMKSWLFSGISSKYKTVTATTYLWMIHVSVLYA